MSVFWPNNYNKEEINQEKKKRSLWVGENQGSIENDYKHTDKKNRTELDKGLGPVTWMRAFHFSHF